MKTNGGKFSIRAKTICLMLATLTLPAISQVRHSGERADDFTMVPRVMARLPDTACADGQIAIGSNCIDGPSPSGGLRSWVSYFIGQSRPVINPTSGRQEAIATINLDGTTTFTQVPYNPYTTETADVPLAYSAVNGLPHWGGRCITYSYQSYPLFSASDRLNGRPPSEWVAYSHWVDLDCGTR